jgi:hypothetical protein
VTAATGQPEPTMRPENVPDEYIKTCTEVIHAHYAANPGDWSEENAIRILLAAALPLHAQQIRAEQPPLSPEYGIRAEFISGPDLEVTVAETLGNALAALDEFDAKYGDAVVSRELIERPVGNWRKVGGDDGQR